MIFLLVVVLIVSSIHLYLWKRLVRDTLPPGRWRRVGTFTVVGLAVFLPATLIGTRILPHEQQAILAWPGFIWMALMFYLLVALAVLELPRLALRRWARGRVAAPVAEPVLVPVSVESGGVTSGSVTSGGADGAGPGGVLLAPVAAADANEASNSRDDVDAPAGGGQSDDAFDPSRRLFIARSAAAIAGVVAVGAVGAGTRSALGPPDLKRVTVRLPKLPASMSGFRVALVADIHLGPMLGRAHTARIVRMINTVDADIVAVVGDLVDGSVAELGEAAEPLQDLRARHGSFFVTGNHEYFSGHEEWIEEVNSLGLRVLRNERVDIQGLDLAGVNDVTGGQYGDGPDFAKALDGRDTRRPVVLLAHQPVLAKEAAKRGVDLQLSGHTHGGQMVPFNLLVRAQQPVVAGLEEVDGTAVYVTRGAGFWGPPVRVGAPPDISVIELHA